MSIHDGCQSSWVRCDLRKLSAICRDAGLEVEVEWTSAGVASVPGSGAFCYSRVEVNYVYFDKDDKER